MIKDLSAWLLKQIADLEANWALHESGCYIYTAASFSDEDDEPWCTCDSGELWRAECDAKRQIIALHRPEHAKDWTSCNVCHSGWSSELDPADWPCDTIKLMALPMADRRGYREEWAP